MNCYARFAPSLCVYNAVQATNIKLCVHYEIIAILNYCLHNLLYSDFAQLLHFKNRTHLFCVLAKSLKFLSQI